MDAGERYDEVDREEEEEGGEEEEEEEEGTGDEGGGGWVPPNRVPVMYAPVLSSESASSLYRGNQIARPPKVTTTEMLARWNRCDHSNRRRLKPRDDGVDVMRIEDSSSTT
ncbi:hypothetical protein HZH68_016509 [Vespula germanica]|uniref:Uncharacterized protein n=1 Tax=Vespula germanica TaxID=30212 RepID=A0A834MR63_VESGE|nr:hypothetical protein HZH68_016509 [Vespula germanica]